MYNVQQIQTMKTMQVKLAQSLYKFKDALTLPEYNFLKDICLGILKGQSIINLKIAKQLNESITAKKTCERFTRHLNKQDFGSKIQDIMIGHQSNGFDHETCIIVDESDIIKPQAKTMEGLQKVRDGSSGRYDQSGYALLNIIAYQNSSQGYEIKPISSDLIARDMELDSVAHILEDRLIEIALASGNQGVYLFDRGYDDKKLFGFLKDNGMNYIVRAMGDRNLIMDGKEQSFKEVAKSVKLNQAYTIKGSNQQIECGIKRVKLSLEPHPKKHPETIDTWLIVSRFSPNENGKQGYFYFLCDFPGQPHLMVDAIIEKVLRMYRMRWKIEEVHRHIKQEYGWEKIQLTSYTRLKNMNQMLMVTMCFLYSLKKYACNYLIAFHSIMSYSNHRWKQIFDFCYYKLTELIKICFAGVSRYHINPFAGKWLEQNQLEIPCLKNGGM